MEKNYFPKTSLSEEEEVFVSNSLFTAEQLDELLLVYDQIAQREVNLLRRYHYVSAARLLAKLTDRAERVSSMRMARLARHVRVLLHQSPTR